MNSELGHCHRHYRGQKTKNVLEWLRVDLILSHLEREKLTEPDWITIVIVIRSHRSTSAICDLLLQSTDVGGLYLSVCVCWARR